MKIIKRLCTYWGLYKHWAFYICYLINSLWEPYWLERGPISHEKTEAESGNATWPRTRRQKWGFKPGPDASAFLSENLHDSQEASQQMNQDEFTKLRICPARPYLTKRPSLGKWGEKRHAVVRNISYSLEYLELGQAGHWQVNYLYLTGDGNENGDRLSFWAPPWGAILAPGSPGVETGELEESG